MPDDSLPRVDKFEQNLSHINSFFDELLMRYLRGKDIRNELKGLSRFDLLSFMNSLLGNEDFLEHLEENDLTDKQKQKLMDFREKYKVLSIPVKLANMEVSGMKNPIINVESHTPDLSKDSNSVLSEFKAISGNREIIHAKITLGMMSWFISSLLQVLKETIEKVEIEDIDLNECKEVRMFLTEDFQDNLEGILNRMDERISEEGEPDENS